MPTIKDVARRADVSVATVSAVINGDSDVNVSQELTEKVEQAVEELDYHPNQIARALSRKKTNTIAYIIPSVSNQFFAQMTELVEDLASNNDYGVYICNTGSGEERVNLYKNNIISGTVDGVLVTLTWLIRQSNFIESLKKENIPVVGLAGARVIEEIDTVIIDDEAGGRLAAKYLTDKGYSKIGFVGLKQSRTTEKRLLGIKKYLEKHGDYSYDEDRVIKGTQFNREEGSKMMGKLLEKQCEIDAVIVYNDLIATGVLDKLQEEQVEVPGEIAVLGFDDSVAEYTRPKLTSMALSKKEMSYQAVQMLFERINNKNGSKEIPPRHKRVMPRLVERETT